MQSHLHGFPIMLSQLAWVVEMFLHCCGVVTTVEIVDKFFADDALLILRRCRSLGWIGLFEFAIDALLSLDINKQLTYTLRLQG